MNTEGLSVVLDRMFRRSDLLDHSKTLQGSPLSQSLIHIPTEPAPFTQVLCILDISTGKYSIKHRHITLCFLNRKGGAVSLVLLMSLSTILSGLWPVVRVEHIYPFSLEFLLVPVLDLENCLPPPPLSLSSTRPVFFCGKWLFCGVCSAPWLSCR